MKMKKYTALFLLLLVFVSADAQQDITSRLTAKMSAEIMAVLQTSPYISKQSKVVVLNLMNVKDKNDSLRTPLGVHLSKNITHELLQTISKKSLPYLVLVPNIEAERMMSSFFIMPDSVDESDFWNKYLNNQKPDYYLSASYVIADDYSAISIVNCQLIPDRYNISNRVIPVKNVSVELQNDEDKKQLMQFQVIQDVKQLCDQFAYHLKFYRKIKNIQLHYFNEEGSGAMTPFSKKLGETLTASLTRVGGYQVTQVTMGTRGLFTKEDLTPYEISGKYVQEGERVKVTGFLKNSTTQAVVSSAEFYLPASVLQNNGNGVVDLTAKLQADLWTNKGNENVSYQQGESMRIYYQVNKPCFVRVLYITSENDSIVLLDNYSIEMKEAGKPMMIMEGTSSSPYGKEKILLLSSTVQLPPITYVVRDNIKVIVPNSAPVASRGFKVKEESDTKELSLVSNPK